MLQPKAPLTARDIIAQFNPHKRRLLSQLLEHPNESLWARAGPLVISPVPLLTLEMAVSQIAVRPYRGAPDPFTVYRALKYTAELHSQYLLMLSEC